MKFASREDSVSLASTNTSAAFGLESMEGIAIGVSWTDGGALDGEFTIEVTANDPFTDNVYLIANPDAIWVELTGSNKLVSGSDTHLWNIEAAYYKGIRLVYTRTAGTGTAAVHYNAKGLQ